MTSEEASSSCLHVAPPLTFTVIFISEYLLDSYCHCKARTGVAKCVLVFNSLCRAQTGIAKCVIAFDSLCGA